MARPIIPGPAPTERSRRRRLLAGSALCGATLALAAAAHGQTLPGIPLAAAIKFNTGGALPVITAPNANALDVVLNGTRTVINWDSFHVSGADSVTFHFGQTSDIVLNKSPTQVQVDANGQVIGLVGAAAGGNIWFYSPQGVVIAPGAVMSAGNFVFARGDAIVDATFVDAASPLSVLRSASDSLIQMDSVTMATGASISATGDVVLTASTGDLIATTVLAAGSANVSTTTGSVNIGELTATAGAATVNSGGGITLGAFNAGTTAMATAQTDVSVTSASAGGATGDIVLTSLTNASLGSGTAGRDIKIMGPTGASLGSGTAGHDVFVTTTTGPATVTGAVQAGDDIEITATLGSVSVTGAGLTSTGANATGDAHVLAQSTAGSASVSSATTQGTGAAAGDITVSGATTASLGSGNSSHNINILGPAASLGSGSAAADVFVTATTGSATVTGAVTAGDDIEVTATTGSVVGVGATLTSSGAGAIGDAHVLALSTGGAASVSSAMTLGTGAAAGDITVQGATSASLGSGSSSHDIKVLGPTASLGSGSAAGDVFVTATTGGATVTGAVSAGDDIEVTATTGSVVAIGASLTSTGAGAIGDAHVLAQSTGGSAAVSSAATQGTGAAAGDITVSAGATASLGSGTSSHNINVLGPSASLGSGSAAGDVFVTATTGGATVTGAVSAGDDIEVTATAGSVSVTGSLTATGAGAIGDAHVLAQSTGGSASVTSATTQGSGAAAGDITVEGATTASLTAGNSSRDLKVLGPSASLGSGGAARDVFVTGTTGPVTVTGPVSAADDVEVTATTGSITVTGPGLKSTGSGAVGDAHVLAQSTGGSVSVSSAMTFGTGAAAGDITIQGATSASLGSGTSTHNLNVIGSSASLGSGTATGSVFVTATTGGASVTGAVTAGDDIEVTATTGSVSVTGAGLTSTGVGAADDAHILARSTGGPVSVSSATTQATGAAAGNITIDGSTTATLTGAATATGDVQLFAGSSVAAGGSTITAGRDVAVRATSGDVSLGTASAGDDIAIRAPAGAVTASGDLLAGQTQDPSDPDPTGAADALTGATMVGHDLDIKAQTVAVSGNVSAGRAPVGSETLGAAQVASDVIVEATSPDPTPGVAALQLATGPGKAVTAHGDVSLRNENAAAGSIQTGDVFAGRDVAVDSAAGNVTLNSALAGDDVVLRAPNGLIAVTGNVESGRDSPGMTPTDSAGAGDALNAQRPFLDFDSNPGTVFSVVGFDVNVAGQSVHIGGATIAGRQPSTDSPNTAGPVDTTTSDVRIETRLSATPTTGLTPDIQLGDVIATRDMQIDSAGGITAGNLIAGRDVAVLGRGGATPGLGAGDHTGAGTTIASALAGDDALIFSIFGRSHILGSVSSGVPLQRLVPTNDRTIDGATEAADQLAIYLHYFDLDDASAPYVLPGGVIQIVGQGVTVGGALTAHGIGSDIRLLSTLDIAVAGTVNAGGIATFQTQGATAGSLTVGAVTAAGDVMLDSGGTAGTSVQAGTLTSTNGDVAVHGAAASLTDVSAGDDVVIRAAGAVTVSGVVSAGGGTDSVGLGDGFLTTYGALTVQGHGYDLTGHNVDIVAGSLTAGTLTATGAQADVRIQTTSGVISVGDLTASRDVLLDGAGAVTAGAVTGPGDVLLDSHGASVTATGTLTSANGDVAVHGAAVNLADVSAGDDVVIRATGALTVTGAVTAGGGTDSVGLGDGLLTSYGALTVQGHSYDLTGHNVDIVAGSVMAGALTATGAQADVRIQTTSGVVSVGDLTASRDVLLDGAGAVTAGVLSATRDVGVRSRGSSVTLGSASAGDDVVIRGQGSILVTGTLSAGGGADSSASDQAGDLIFSGARTNVGGNLNLVGQTVDVRSNAGSIQVVGAVTATTDARFQTQATTGGSVSVTTVTAGENILLDGGGAGATGALATGTLTATDGDVAVRARDGNAISLADVSAGDDLVLRATGAIGVSGLLTAGGGTDSAGLGDALATAAGQLTVSGHAYDQTGHNIDIVGGTVTVPTAITAGGDIRIQTTGVVSLSDLTAGRDVLVDGGSTVTTGVLSGGRDVGVRSTGGSVTIASAAAGDDVVLRAKGSILVNGTLSAGAGADSSASDQAGDLIFAGAKTNLGGNLDLVGGTVDVRSSNGSIQIMGAVTASTDARFQTQATTGGSVTVAGVTAGRDVLLDGGGAGANGAVATGTLTATSGDVAVRARDGSAIQLADVSAGDDVVLRTSGNVTVSGAVSAGGGTDSAGLGDALVTTDGAVTLEGHAYDLAGHDVDIVGGTVTTIGTVTATGSGSDIRVQSVGVLNLADLTAGRDVLVDGASTVTTGMLSAGRDVGVRSTGATTSVTVASASAGDDVVIRANGSINVTGALSAGTGADSAATDQAGDLIFGAAKSNLGGDLDLVGGTVDVRSTAGSILVGGPVTAATDARFQTQATTGGSVMVADVTAGRDVLLDGGATGVTATGTVTATTGDVAVRGRDGSAVNLAGVSAGDDVVVRTTGAVTISGTVNAGGGADSSGLGDVLLTTDGQVTLEGHAYDLTGANVDILAGSVTTLATMTAGFDARVQSVGVLNRAGLTAGRDVMVDGASTVSTGVLSAGRDVGVRSTGGATSVTVGSASAGDDVVIRANGSIIVTGALSAGGGTDSTATDQAGDLMFGVAKSNLSGDLDLVGNMVDVRSTAGSILVTGATSAATDARFQTAATTGGSVTVAAVTAGRDVLLDGEGAGAMGTLTATSGDVAVRARDGATISLADVSAGDDVVLRSTGTIQSTGTITTTGQPSTIGLGDKLTDPSEGGVLTIGGMTFGLGDSDIDVAGGMVNLWRTMAAGSVRIAAGDSGSLMGGGSVGIDLLIDTNGSLNVGDLSALGDIGLRARSGVLTVGNLTAGDDIVLRATQGVTTGVLKVTGGADHVGVGDMLFAADPTGLNGNFDLVGNTIDVKSTSGPISLGGAEAGDDVRLQTTSGLVTISGQVTAGRDIFVDGDSVAATGGLTAGRDIALYGRSGGVGLASASAGNDLVVRAAGDVTASGDLKSGQGAATAGVGGVLIAATGPVSLFGTTVDPGVGVIDVRGANITLNGSIQIGGSGVLRLQSTGATTLANATVAGDITIDSAGDVTGGALTAGRDIAVRSSAGAISIASAAAKSNVVLRAVNDITVSGSITGGAVGDSAGPGVLLITATGPASVFGEATDPGVGVVDLRGANIKIGGSVSAGVQLRLRSTGATTLADASASGDIAIDADGGVTGGALSAGRDLAVRSSGGAISLASAAAGDDIVLRAAKDVTVSGSLNAGGAADSVGAGDALFATDPTVLAGNLDLAGANIDVRAHGAIAVGGTATATGDVRFQTVGGGGIDLDAVTSGRDVLADGGSVQATGTLSAVRDVAVRGRTGTVQLASIVAGDNIAIRAAGDVAVTGAVSSGSGPSASGAADALVSASESGMIMRLVDPLAATPSIEGFTLKAGDIDILSGGAISLAGNVAAGGAASSLHLQAAGKISAAGITAGDSIFARGGDFALSGTWRANTVRLEVTASGGLALGDGVSAPSGGAALSSAAIGLIDAPTLQIFLGDSSGSMRGAALSIGTLGIDTTKIKTSLELYAGAASEVTISGVFAPLAGGASTTALRIGAPNADVGDWTPGSIRVIANTGGSIGFSTTATGRTFSDVRAFGSVELNATNDILIGYQDFIDKLSATPASGVAQAVKTILAPQTSAPHMLITAGSLTLRANGKVAQQDVEGLLGANPTGLYLLGAGGAGGATAPPILVLGRTSMKAPGDVQMPDYIELNGAITSGGSIMTGGSASLSNVIAFEKSVPPSAFYRLNSCAILQPGSCTSSTVHTSISFAPDQLTGLTVQDRTAAAGTADPTVASATNEEVWKDQR